MKYLNPPFPNPYPPATPHGYISVSNLNFRLCLHLCLHLHICLCFFLHLCLQICLRLHLRLPVSTSSSFPVSNSPPISSNNLRFFKFTFSNGNVEFYTISSLICSIMIFLIRSYYVISCFLFFIIV